MNAKVQVYIPHCFKSFQGFSVKDIKEFRQKQHMELVLESEVDRVRLCNCCGHKLGNMHDRYWVSAKHLRAFGWTVSVGFFREKDIAQTARKFEASGSIFSALQVRILP